MSNLEPLLYSYKMTHVTGKAPCVYEKELVLAACKPKLRLHILPGNWVAGWTSKSLKACPTEVSGERLVYLARVDEKIARLEYETRYADARPCAEVRNEEEEGMCGGRCDSKEEDDEKCDGKEPVLVCKEFYYFGARQSLKIPETPENLRPRVPVGQDYKGWETQGEQALRFIDFVRQHDSECIKSNKTKN